ncbi:E3 ubiquitin- ligase [Lecanosticta acicola]|uniref:RING-type E3 ubiquitin transferase n=1 Tax=Lecanosticta acicola TaxID=111012 RepID=A0AAI8Z2A0_9PEZI|nr:E3 ubiquitin- ligase [Lecanosticta acicola]
MDRSQTPQQRELVYCHQCENEWYRDEHGIICPECQSDFTEIIEDSNRDPRDDDAEEHGFDAPDPDEGDIDDFFNWQPNAPGQPPGGRFQGTFTRNMNLSNQAGAAQGGGGLLGGLLGSAIQGLLSGQRPPQQASQGQGASRDTSGAEGQGNPQTPGSLQQNQPQWAQPGTTVRHGHGPGYSFTITTSSGGTGLVPRDANGAQPFQRQPAALQQMLDEMVRNIGVAPMGMGPGFGGGGMYGGGMHGGPGGPMMGMGAGPPIPMADLMQLFGMGGGQHGDAVYTQEALDRVISQLMEQHQSGNAPPPASTDAIESLPKRPVTQEDVGDNGKADCSICMDDAEVGSMVTELPCGHWFHHDCIKAWLTEHDTCPHCRQGIMPKDQPNNDRARDPNQAPHHDMHTAEQQRAPSTQGEGGSSGGMFSRMRQAFGGNRGENRESQGQ